ncbi:hypothetical protein [uncultured Catenibacterium sp.]|uniref:hypothetical protein n=1 Tax=uncultured Catenibacterium sp. TaxID=286142 RepID=UPI002592DDE7|nr:hypothetical protein [uncultured Catenibacterium sp.]
MFQWAPLPVATFVISLLIGKIISQVGLVVGTFINYVKSKDRKYPYNFQLAN